MPATQDLVVRDLVRLAPGGRLVLDHLSSVFAAGEVTAVHGTNGSGKSVLSRTLAGVDRPNGGRVISPARSTYFLPERAPVLAGGSARTVAAALASRVGSNQSDWRPRLEDALVRLGSTHGSRAALRRLSKGNLQKVYLAIAHAVQPTVAVLDEPMTGLDPRSADAAAGILTELAAGGSVVVITAHHAVGVAETNLRLCAGRLAAEADPAGRVFGIELAPASLAVQALEAGRLGRAVPDSGVDPTSGRVRVRAAEADVPDVLRAAMDGGLSIEAVFEAPA